MRWHRTPLLLLALAGCGGETACTLVGCVSQLTVRLPPGVAAGTACVDDVCTSEVVGGALQVPLSRRAEGTTADVTVTLPGRAEPYEGTVTLLRTRPNGADCGPVCVNGTAAVDIDAGTVTSVALPPPGS